MSKEKIPKKKRSLATCSEHFGMSCAASRCQTSQFVKSIHNSSPISLGSPCRLPCYPREDRCGSKVLWDPDGTFLTIRFGLPLENDPLPVCDTNVSSSASNETTPPNENLKNTFSFCPRISLSWFKWKANVLCLLASESWAHAFKKKIKNYWKCDEAMTVLIILQHFFQGKPLAHSIFVYHVLPIKSQIFSAQIKLAGRRMCGYRLWFSSALIHFKPVLSCLLDALLVSWPYWSFSLKLW